MRLLLVLLDEAGAKTSMTRLRGRAPRGRCLYAKAPHGHWKTTTMIASVRLNGSSACMIIAGATDMLVFREYVRHVLCPSLRLGDVVVMDNLVPHKSIKTLALIEAAGASVRFLPAYSPDLNSIEKMWSKVKTSCAPPKRARCPNLKPPSPPLYAASPLETPQNGSSRSGLHEKVKCSSRQDQ